MTNLPWAFSIRGLRESLQLERLVVINDFTALALALPALPAEAWRQVGGGQAVPGAAMALIGPGTGLGVSGLVPSLDGSQLMPISGEGGHVSLAGCEPEEVEVLKLLQRRFGHASAERALSGPGIENLHHALAQARGEHVPLRDAAAIVHDALAGSDALSRDTLGMFCALLGSASGNLALTLGARGGLFIGGGIVPRLGEWFDHSPFRARFEAKGRFAGYLHEVPTQVLVHSEAAALLGAARALGD